MCELCVNEYVCVNECVGRLAGALVSEQVDGFSNWPVDDLSGY